MNLEGIWTSDLVSIHAPARGATTSRTIIHSPPACFNPRAREGRDPIHLYQHGVHCVSIHAPARGATQHRAGRRSPGMVSIHAPARGATPNSGAMNTASTSFNPRAREGRDLPGVVQDPPRLGVSIHAPARGATPVARLRREDEKVSIHAPARGATNAVHVAPLSVLHVSIHAPARGATSTARLRTALAFWFQSTRPRGARRWCGQILRRRSRCFNPRAREGRDAHRGHARSRREVSIHAPARGATYL